MRVFSSFAALLALAVAATAHESVISLRGLQVSNVTTTTVPVTTTVTPPPTPTPMETTLAPTTLPVTTTPAVTTSVAPTTTVPTSTQPTQTPPPTQPNQPTQAPQPTQAQATPAPTSESSSGTGPTRTPKPTTLRPTPVSNDSGDSGISSGAVIGIVVGIVCGVGVLAGLVYMCVKKKNADDDDLLSPNDFGAKDVTPVYNNNTKPVTPVQPSYAPATTATATTGNSYAYSNDYAANPYQQPTAPAAIAAVAAAQHQPYADMYGQTSPTEFYDRESATSSEPSNHSGKNAWMQAMQKPNYDSDGVDIDRLDTNSYNSAKFDDSGSDVSRDSSFLSRDESLGSSVDDFPSHRGTKQERGSYEL
ncbi:hypothetical protein SPRG_05075 [Saprolegnia parasitica CBS 223.65]|uniref:Mid2 domain-containing protein n=1 Tax=Saprolegnia parasitica (strain CBS 223.65) TaxID=695850 RepID=A0A067CHZ9_SAPPC|nr:hypothetical protein SPRG_05075 [Saprolegnia parasitica CBS 223.65]KDO30364.1 hypothetical protein SPRG_05075 [Saprolegnia parasitica CBS 223.65]|eukprot:XP_012198974.1 hypothetical protein SPRG_05075 [Saprolegnia parasitica CBS 223.65]